MAFLFPGQGSQCVGMGSDLFNEYDFVREIFDATNEIAKANISKLCFKGPLSTLTKTYNLQPAITAVNIACLSAIEKEGHSCDVAMGHSLGEYSALRAARVLSLSDTLQAIVTRGRLMSREAVKHKGTMYALIGLDRDAVESLIKQRQSTGVVSVANHNSKYQIIISGHIDSVNEVASASRLMSARAIPLKVSGAWHSAMMQDAETEFSFCLNKIKFENPLCKIIHNVNHGTTSNLNEMKDILVRQISNPVLWYDSILRLVSEKINVFVEIGPGKILTGLLKKTLPDNYHYQTFNVSDMRTLEKFLHAVT